MGEGTGGDAIPVVVFNQVVTGGAGSPVADTAVGAEGE